MTSTPTWNQPLLWSFAQQEQGLAANNKDIETMRGVAEVQTGTLIIGDSTRKLLVAPLGSEEKEVRLISPLQKLKLQLAPYNISIVYVHHSGKGRADESPITAGSGGTA